MSHEKPTVLLLVGQKGAGKTTIGGILERRLGIASLRIELIYLAVLNANPGLPQHEMEPLGFGAILDALAKLAATSPVICLETTATAGYFPEFLSRLQADYRLRLVRVIASSDDCLSRVQTRDRTNHIPVSDDRVREINRIAAQVALPWDLEIENSGTLDEAAVVSAIKNMFSASSAKSL